MAKELIVFVGGRVKGSITFEHKKVWWHRNNSGVDSYPKDITLAEITQHIARVCLVSVDQVRFEPVDKVIEESNSSLHEGNDDPY